jgi:hypothetical protein
MKSTLLAISLLLCAVSSSYAADPGSDNVVTPANDAYEVVIPAAGKVEGANGTFFRSDVTLVNPLNRTLIISARWIPQPNKAPDVRNITLQAKEVKRYDDFVENIFREEGLGAVVLTAVTSDGGPDTSARFYVSSRIYTPQLATGGSTSQSFPAVPMSSIDTTSATLFGLGAEDPGSHFRVNVGIVNLDSTRTQTFVISVPQSVGTPLTYNVTLPPRTMQQVNNVIREGSQRYVRILNQTESDSRSGKWIAYSSTVESTTGDAWSELAISGSF